MNTFYRTAILIFCIGATFLASCKTEKKSKTIVCFIDFSGTPDWEARMQSLKAVVRNNIINKLSYNTKLVVLPLDKESITNGKEILVADIKDKFEFIPDMTAAIDEEKIAQNNLQKTKDSINTLFAANFDIAKKERQATAQGGTDIFGALQQASRYTNNKQKNLVVLLSDMMNWNNDLKMEPGSFTEANITTSLKKVPPVNLKNADVFVYTGNVSNISAGHYKVVQKFWQEYFKQQGVHLKDYSSAALTKLESLISE